MGSRGVGFLSCRIVRPICRPAVLDRYAQYRQSRRRSGLRGIALASASMQSCQSEYGYIRHRRNFEMGVGDRVYQHLGDRVILGGEALTTNEAVHSVSRDRPTVVDETLVQLVRRSVQS